MWIQMLHVRMCSCYILKDRLREHIVLVYTTIQCIPAFQMAANCDLESRTQSPTRRTGSESQVWALPGQGSLSASLSASLRALARDRRQGRSYRLDLHCQGTQASSAD